MKVFGILMLSAVGLFAADDLGTGDRTVEWGTNLTALAAVILALGYTLTKLIPRFMDQVETISKAHVDTVREIETNHKEGMKAFAESCRDDSQRLSDSLLVLSKQCAASNATLGHKQGSEDSRAARDRASDKADDARTHELRTEEA